MFVVVGVAEDLLCLHGWMGLNYGHNWVYISLNVRQPCFEEGWVMRMAKYCREGVEKQKGSAGSSVTI